jgi:ribosomal protein S18 acetylase RimI-like enzyme
MNSENIYISDNLTENGFTGIAKCHKNAFPQQFLSRSGIDILSGFYKWHSENNEIIIAASNNNCIIGFVLGGKPSYLAEYRNEILKKHPLRFLLSLFSKDVIFSGFNYILNYVKIKSENNSKNIPYDFYYLSVISVDSNYRGKMVAEDLIKAFEAECHERKFKGYYLNVSTENTRAIAFYKKQKMEIFKTDKKSTVMIKNF